MHILILGGGVFLGAAVLRTALERGHELTVFNRGRAQSAWPEGVQAIVGDRAGDLSALAGQALRRRHRHLRLCAGGRAQERAWR